MINADIKALIWRWATFGPQALNLTRALGNAGPSINAYFFLLCFKLFKCFVNCEHISKSGTKCWQHLLWPEHALWTTESTHLSSICLHCMTSVSSPSFSLLLFWILTPVLSHSLALLQSSRNLHPLGDNYSLLERDVDGCLLGLKNKATSISPTPPGGRLRSCEGDFGVGDAINRITVAGLKFHIIIIAQQNSQKVITGCISIPESIPRHVLHIVATLQRKPLFLSLFVTHSHTHLLALTGLKKKWQSIEEW